MRFHYYTTYEKGVPGFSVFAIIIAKQQPCIDVAKPESILSSSFVAIMSQKEEEMKEFLSKYYNTLPEQHYTNYDRICKIKEI